MTPEQRLLEANKFNRLNKLNEQLGNEIVLLNSEAVRSLNTSLGAVYEINYNSIAEQFKLDKINLKESKKESKDTISPYQTIAVDKVKDKTQINSKILGELTSAVVTGVTLGGIFAQVKKVLEDNLNSTKTIAINAYTRTENLARFDSAVEATSFVPIKKEWVAILDENTREAHRAANGQRVNMDEPFKVNGEELMFPADIAGSLGNIINCRCTTRFVTDNTAFTITRNKRTELKNMRKFFKGNKFIR